MEIIPSNTMSATPKIKPDDLPNVTGSNKVKDTLGIISPEKDQEKSKSVTDESQRKDLNKKDLEQAIDKLNKMSELFNFRLQFRVHKETGRIFCKVVNPDTGEVLREIPSEKILDMIGKIEEMAGLILDKYV
ncbi:flagellar protein FlaG [Pelotomaculum isophthalicicum JI]|uniref:Flagellar protein FlaG n=1 Tax=Pelotomaculum isophthalicicum JI TaxID=947010 RepID=A0A9X4GZT8_9FIRM|nr:flagellar protein FlaG [Pelotomaculum isophthalicicum]MDF9409140.1 flagellar protein FlaG [Pelotomaculum isophthalicicum JI]